MRPKTMIAVLAAGGILGGAFAARGLADERRPGRHRAGFGALADYLGLSADQRQQLASLREEHRKSTAPLRAEGRELGQKLRDALAQESPDPATVGAAMIALSQHHDKMKAEREALEDQIKAQLSPEQQKKFEAFKAARGVERGRGRGFGGGPGGFGPFPDDAPDGPEESPEL